MASRRKNKKSSQNLAQDLQPYGNAICIRLSEEYCEKIRAVSEICVPDCKVQPVIKLLIDLGYEEYERKLKAEGKDSLTKSIRDAYWNKVLSGAKKRDCTAVTIPISRIKHLWRTSDGEAN